MGRTIGDSTPDWSIGDTVPPEGAPNILLVLIDDAGFGQPSIAVQRHARGCHVLADAGRLRERTKMDPARKPSVLFVYYTYTQQTLKVVEAMAEVFRDRGCDVNLAAIELTDPRYQKRFSQFPMPKPFLEVVATIPAELRRRPAKIGIPDVVTEPDYDLVCIGSPTWWLSTDVPIRSFLESDTATRLLEGKPFAAAVCCRRYWKHNLKTVRRLGTKRGGVFADGIHFRYQGGQVRSLLSLLSYLGSGEYRQRYLGVKIPPTNLQDHHLRAARKFADGLANRLLGGLGDPRVPGVASRSRRDAEDVG